MREMTFGELFRSLYNYRVGSKEILDGKKVDEEKKDDDKEKKNNWVKYHKRKFDKKVEEIGLEPFIKAIDIKISATKRFIRKDEDAVWEILNVKKKDMKNLSEEKRLWQWLLIVETMGRWKNWYCMSDEEYEDFLIEKEVHIFGCPSLIDDRERMLEKVQPCIDERKAFFQEIGLENIDVREKKVKEIDEIWKEVKERLAQFYQLEEYMKGELDQKFLDIVAVVGLNNIHCHGIDLLGSFSKDDDGKDRYIENILEDISDETESGEDLHDKWEKANTSFRCYYREQRPSLSRELADRIEKITNKVKTLSLRSGGSFKSIVNEKKDREIILLEKLLNLLSCVDDLKVASQKHLEEIRKEILQCEKDVIEELKAQYLQYTGKTEFKEKIDIRRLLLERRPRILSEKQFRLHMR